MEARCGNGILFFRVVTADGQSLVEVKCRSARCGAEAGVVVLHRFRLDGTLHGTQQFKDPGVRKENPHGHDSGSAALRSA
jgi:hypothetical protein